jgi:plasmid stabilization system protein ParE
MSGCAFHPDAFADLDEIWEYIAPGSLAKNAPAAKFKRRRKLRTRGLRVVTSHRFEPVGPTEATQIGISCGGRSHRRGRKIR